MFNYFNSLPQLEVIFLIIGGLGSFTYTIFRKELVIITGQLFGVFIYLRNLILIYKKNIYEKN